MKFSINIEKSARARKSKANFVACLLRVKVLRMRNRISKCLPVPDEDKEEDERDDGEGEHQDPPEQPGAGLAAVQAVFARQSQPVRRMPAIIPVNLCQSFPASSFL